MSPPEPLLHPHSGAPDLRPVEAERIAAGSVGVDRVAAQLLYAVPGSPRGVLYMYPPPPGTARLSGPYQAHQMEILDARKSSAELDVQGFVLCSHDTALVDAYDDAEVRSIYYPEMERLVRQMTGAREVLVFDHNLRSDVRARAGQAGVYEPVRRVHNDYTHVSALRRVEQLLGAEAAKRRLERRLAIVNVWRPLFGPVQDTPLAICDGRSIEERDLIAIDLLYRDRVGENFSFAHNPQHRWYYVPQMQANEALLLKCYDTAGDGRCPFTAHSAFDHPHAPPGARPRESIEIRTLVFFDTPVAAS
ncbi:MAG: CmcJ/NvfI family oxidoreductase [Deltaproteobacteria bacterium]